MYSHVLTHTHTYTRVPTCTHITQPGTRSSIINSLQYEDTLDTAEKTMALYNIEKPEVHIGKYYCCSCI